MHLWYALTHGMVVVPHLSDLIRRYTALSTDLGGSALVSDWQLLADLFEYCCGRLREDNRWIDRGYGRPPVSRIPGRR